MEFKEYFALSQDKIRRHLKDYCKSKEEDDAPSLFKEQEFIQSLYDFASKGKLLRGSIFLFTVEALGEKVTKQHLDIACAIEFMHSALLIQDDIIDNDYERRGAKTIFANYEEKGRAIKAFDPYHYGISSGIVVADIAFFYAIDLLANHNVGLQKIIKFYSKEVYNVVLAEGADSVFGQTKAEPSKSDIENVYLYKTARYTFSLPFELGVIVAEKDSNLQKKLSKLGELVGIIFQLKDDEIGLLGKEDEIGKPVGSDIRENKKTLLRYYLYKKSSLNDRKVLDKYFGNQNLDKKGIEIVISVYNKLQIQDLIDKEVKKIMEEALVIFEELPFDKKYKKILKGLLEFNISRAF